MTRQAKDALAKAQQNVQTKDAVATTVAELLTRYSFDLSGYDATRWIEQWLSQYPPLWLRSGVIEALYQGRYKAISVWQILDLWQRRGQPLQHFNREFERMVAGRTFQLLFPNEQIPAESGSAEQARIITVPTQANGGWHSNGTHAARFPAHFGSEFQIETSIEPSIEDDPAAGCAAAAHVEPPIIQTFKPAASRIVLPRRTQPSLPQVPRAITAPIQRFTPHLDGSEFHDKLKAIAQALTLTNAHTPIWGAGGSSIHQPSQGSPVEPEPPELSQDSLSQNSSESDKSTPQE